MALDTTVGSGAAAVAAIASWASVLQSRKVIRDASSPDLRAGFQFVRPSGNQGPARLAVEVHNVGGGIARDVGFAVACDGQWAYESVATFLHAQLSEHFGTDINPSAHSSEVRGLVIWRDASERIYAWSAHDRTRRVGGRQARVNLAETWERFYPDYPLEALERRRAFRSGALLP